MPADQHDHAAPGDPPPLMLSVSGARGIVGKTMTPQVAGRFAIAFASWLKATTGADSPLVVLGRDSRPSGADLAKAATEGLTAVGCRVVRLGVQTTPSIGVMIGHHQADGGMIVTASHNPNPWNGLKCLTSAGVAPPAQQADDIIRRFKDGPDNESGSPHPDTVQFDNSAIDIHINRILEHIPAEPLRAAGLTVVLDSINGAGCEAGRVLLDSLGVSVIHLNGEPTGEFAHTPEPTEANLTDLCARVREHGADIGFAQDPDADRLAIVDETGRYIGEEYTLVLCAKEVLDGLGNTSSSGTGVPPVRDGTGVPLEPAPPGRGQGEGSSFFIATNLSTSRMIDDLAANYPGVQVIRTPVGEANVVAGLKACKGNILLGGEGNGGVIFPPVCWVRDSLSSMALVLSLLVREARPLSNIVDDLPRYTMIKRKFDLTAIGGRGSVPDILEQARKAFAGERIDDTDGIRIDLKDGWVHLRSSNTEPIVRLIGEAATAERAEELLRRVARAGGVDRS